MSYFIAVGSSDGVNVDLRFKDVNEFRIYSVDGTDFSLKEERTLPANGIYQQFSEALSGCSACTASVCVPRDCAGDRMLQKTSAESRAPEDEQSSLETSNTSLETVEKPAGCEGDGHGCDGPKESIARVDLVSDCRAVVCTKIGFQA